MPPSYVTLMLTWCSKLTIWLRVLSSGSSWSVLRLLAYNHLLHLPLGSRPEHMFLQYMESYFDLWPPTFHVFLSQEGGGTVVFTSSSVPDEVRPCCNRACPYTSMSALTYYILCLFLHYITLKAQKNAPSTYLAPSSLIPCEFSLKFGAPLYSLQKA